MAGDQAQRVGVVGELGVVVEELAHHIGPLLHIDRGPVEDPGLDLGRAGARLLAEADRQRRERPVVGLGDIERPLIGHQLQMARGDDADDPVDLLGAERGPDRVVVGAGAHVEVEGRIGLAGPEAVGDGLVAGEDGALIVEAGAGGIAPHGREQLLVPIEGGARPPAGSR